MPKTAIVILNFNGKNYLEQFLPSVLKYSNNYTIYVADNASTDNSVAFLKQNYPQVKVLTLNKNYGYAGGYNKALQQIKADYFVLLNSDIEVTENWLDCIIDKMEKNPTIAAAQPKILSYHNKNFFEYAGASGGFIDYLGYPFCRGRIFDTLEIDNGQYNDERTVFWASGACLVVRSDVFFKAGMLDDAFFAHQEEIDLCWRMQKLGYKIYVFPQSKVYHVGGGTLNATNPKKTYLNFRNNLLLLHKNLDKNRLSIIFIRLLLDGLAGIKFLTDLKPKHTLAIIKAHFAFYLMLSQNKQKRITSVSNSKPEGIYNKSILKAYYLKKQKTFKQLNF
jgi:hypothetical protein